MPLRTPVDQIAGNASDCQKEFINDAMTVYSPETGFHFPINDRMRLAEASETKHPDVKGGKILRAVFEMTVEHDMVDMVDNLHSGCAAYLADLCTSATYAMDKTWGWNHLSASLDVTYHATAPM
ncbi:hypothetical protein FRB94_007563 [Tulasnella sp. JGI-2019a]|nr:hypothetical protein FRB94_007563 [Tulasnella sp. JGI-2019a]